MNYKIESLKPFGVLVTPADNKTQLSYVAIESLRELFLREHLIVLRGFDRFLDQDSFVQYCEGFGEISLWPFGKVLELTEHENPEDHIFDNSYVPMHWDGMYRKQVPEYQIFHCLKAPKQGQGGRTLFSNTLLVLEHASEELKSLWSKVTGVYQRVMAFYNSKTASPIVSRHPYNGSWVIRYNEPHCEQQGVFINPPNQTFNGLSVEQLEGFHHKLKAALYDPQHLYAHQWQDGDVVLADNFSLLHGREAFVSQSPRHLWRVQVESDPAFDNPGLEAYQ